jgi:Flp pilus assembly protein TadG
MRKAGRDSEEHGAAVIEGAMILLTLFTLIFAIIEAGRMFNVQEVTTNAAREGARLAVAPLTQTSTLPSDTAIRDRANTFLRASAITNATITINDGNGVGTPVIIDGNRFTRVRVDVPYSFLNLPLLAGASVTLSGEALMRNETTP